MAATIAQMGIRRFMTSPLLFLVEPRGEGAGLVPERAQRLDATRHETGSPRYGRHPVRAEEYGRMICLAGPERVRPCVPRTSPSSRGLGRGPFKAETRV